jgi:uncharacterized RDD family membrane protein YckC
MNAPNNTVRFCRFCGAGLAGEAAYCSGCGRETVQREVAHPIPQGETRVAEEGWRYASVWRRFLSLAMDVAFAVGAYCWVCFLIGLAWGAAVGEPTESQINNLVGLAMILALVSFFLYLWIGTASGGTLSQRIMGLRVLNKETTQPPGAGRALIRVLMSVSVSILFYCLGYFWALGDKEKQTWHDKAAGTIVVAAVTPASRQAAISPAQYA